MTDIAEIAETAAGNAEESRPNNPAHPDEHTAIARCILARQRAFGKALACGKSDFGASIDGNQAFLHALPPLSGFDNIRDYVACLTYAIAAGVISNQIAGVLLEGAKVALATLRPHAKPSLRTAA